MRRLPRVAIVVFLAAACVAIVAAWRLSQSAGLEGVRPPATPPIGQSTSRSDLEQTVTSARSRLRADGRDAAAAVALADALLRKARVDGDGAHAVEAERVLTALLREEPGEYTALRALGAVYLAQHRFRDAIAAAHRASSIRPADAWNFGVLGDAWIELGEYDRAFDAFDEMVKRRPDAASYARVAYAHEIQGRLRDALRHMRMAADATSAHDPESLAWHYAQLGQLHFQLGELDAAAREFARANHVFPGHPYAEAGLARVDAALGRSDRALARLRTLFDRAPSPELAAATGDLQMALGDSEHAHAMYARAEALERDGWKSEAPQPAALARLLAERGLRAEEAVQLAERAAADRADIFTMDALAWSYFRAGRLMDARKASIAARRTGTSDRRILYHAAAIERAAGNVPEARALVDRALAGHPSFDAVAAAEARALAEALSEEQ